MSRIPNDLKSKYNKDSKFMWVDSQWEKFMEKQKVLEAELSYLKKMVKETPNNYQLGKKIRIHFNNGIDNYNDDQINIFDE